ncbi:conserved fungal multispanning membrane protein [Schizosaccharomyces osmophilus]|uniref:Conserved fungal multispanning membrane protein n=1 Tax=Schizosaccharomyces osmophilus TaxID=2545709 RepID=A0AAF0AXK0_9SCHI|nr:conserved fungal multispanning membrane protein [Schizosaccharomyces osmophilus]WBW74178.1 conserved fungal multispanning membrane protein [Schizosaccharomyces osmophilus]
MKVSSFFTSPRTFFKSLSRVSFSFLLIAIFEAIIIISFESYVFGHFYDCPDLKSIYSNSLSVSLTLLLLSTIFLVYMTLEALQTKNTVQVVALCCFHIDLFIISIIQISQIYHIYSFALSKNHDGKADPMKFYMSAFVHHYSKLHYLLNLPSEVKPFFCSLPAIISVCGIILSYLAYIINRENGWIIYQKIGPDFCMRRCYLMHRVFITLIKFDLYYLLGTSIQYAMIISEINTCELILTILVIPPMIAVIIVALYGVTYESRAAMYFSEFMFLLNIAYTLFKIIRMYLPGQIQRYTISSREIVTTFSILSLILLVLTMIAGFSCCSNFNKGLRNYLIYLENKRKQDAGSAYSPNSRMTLDD